MPHDLPLVTTIAAALASAWALGVLAQKVGLNPIVGYLLAGVVIGPYTPGFVGDIGLAAQLAELGVILLMFGVGLHFHVSDLVAVRGIAIPGALAQSAVATLLGYGIGRLFGWSAAGGLVLGLALAVASTVVLMRVLEGRQLLATVHGHVAVGWLLVEDVLTVVVLVVLPALGSAAGGAAGSLLSSLALAVLKLAALVALVLLVGARVVPRMLHEAARLRSRELFTLTVLAVAIAVAAASARFFGVSMALGAFLAGMTVAHSKVSQQAAADALPLRDAFAVLFFVAVGMLFEPAFLLREPRLVLLALLVVLVGKPLAALAAVAALGYSARTGLVVALGLAQIGEFSFILADLGRHHGLLPPAGTSLLVACAIVSISLNPFLFRALEPALAWLQRRPRLWRFLNARAERRGREMNAAVARGLAGGSGPLAVIVGYGPVGRTVERLLREAGLKTVVVDLNLETVAEVTARGGAALFGDAGHPDILEQAGLDRATHFVVTLPHSQNRGPMIAAARARNRACLILVRARYLREREELLQAGADALCFEEVEAAAGLAELVMRDLGRDEETVRRERGRVTRELAG